MLVTLCLASHGRGAESDSKNEIGSLVQRKQIRSPQLSKNCSWGTQWPLIFVPIVLDPIVFLWSPSVDLDWWTVLLVHKRAKGQIRYPRNGRFHWILGVWELVWFELLQSHFQAQLLPGSCGSTVKGFFGPFHRACKHILLFVPFCLASSQLDSTYVKSSIKFYIMTSWQRLKSYIMTP